MLLSAQDIAAALALWPELTGGTAELVNHSENHTFRIDTPGGRRYSLRVHRRGYQSVPAIVSELNWLTALARDTDLPVAQPIPGYDGALLQTFATPDGGERLAVLFPFLPGSEPDGAGRLDDLFLTLGRYAALLHGHARAWTRPAGFERPTWQAQSILAPDGLWGDWRLSPDVDAQSRVVLESLSTVLTGRLAAYGTGADRFGLIHADMRLGNLLVDGDHVTLIDFDDCGFCWFAYDFAAAISFHETRADMPALRAAWCAGYASVPGAVPPPAEVLDAMVMLRRMALLAWIASHGETALAQTHRPGFAAGTLDLAQRFLRGRIWPD
ncbi:phosphotransferase [Devosia sp. FKR38]|uniref:phosphotransferase enzyme family protein n=1 Tax=Devosia sp. FKR38 TaxID=2562312 RepID=UPI0020C0A905|nr:phosphotransferase [Devosia sp. FKR38]